MENKIIFKDQSQAKLFVNKFVFKKFKNRTFRENIEYLKENWKLLAFIKIKKLRRYKFFSKFNINNSCNYVFPNNEGFPYHKIGPYFINIYNNYLLELLSLLVPKLNINEELRIFDVGAHVGESFLQFQIFCRQNKFNLNYTGFEPNLDSFYFLQNFVKINSNFNEKNSLYNIALSNKNRIGKIYFNEEFSGNSRLKDTTFKESNNSSNISCYRLDDIEKLNYSKNFILKIDVERHEQELFEGGIEILKEYRPIVILEILNSEVKEDFKTDSKRKIFIYQLFSNLNYEIYQIQNKSLKKEPITFKKINNFPTNLLFWEIYPDGELNDYLLIPKELEIRI